MKALTTIDKIGVAASDAANTVGADIASASSINLAAATGATVTITGTTDITALGTAPAGVMRRLLFASYLSFVHNDTSLILPNKQNLFCIAGDVANFQSLGSGNWQLVGFLPVHDFKTRNQLNLVHCTATNVGTVGGNGYFTTSNFLSYVINGAVGYARVTPHSGSGLNLVGPLPSGSSGTNYVDWTKPFAITMRAKTKVSTKAAASGGAFCIFAGVNPSTMALGAKGLLFTMRGSNDTTGVNFTCYGHDGTTLNTGTPVAGTNSALDISTFGIRWVPGVGMFAFRNGTCVAKVTGNNLPTGEGPADSNIFGWGIENVSGNTVQAELFAHAITVHTP